MAVQYVKVFYKLYDRHHFSTTIFKKQINFALVGALPCIKNAPWDGTPRLHGSSDLGALL